MGITGMNIMTISIIPEDFEDSMEMETAMQVIPGDTLILDSPMTSIMSLTRRTGDAGMTGIDHDVVDSSGQTSSLEG